MTQLARGYAFVMYVAQPDADYTIPFPYLRTDDVRAFAGDVGDAVEQTFTWTTNNTIRLSGQVPTGVLITIRRFTPRDDTLVHIQNGSMLPAEELNLLSRQLLFVIQEQIDFGTYGGRGLPGGGSGWPNPDGSSPSLAIQQIIDALMQSPVMGLLTSRLDDIDDTAETLMEELLRSDQTFDARRKTEGRLAFMETSVTTLQGNTQSLVKQVTELFAKHDDSAAQILDVRQALATETEARATVATQLNAAIGKAESHITTVQEALATETDARTQAIDTARSDFDTANKAIYQTLSTTYATKDYAQSTAQTQVEAFSNGNFANLQQRFEALVKGAPDTAGEWSANWTVRINGGAINGTPVIAGIGLGVDSKNGSNFIVMADRFGIVSPTYTTNGGVQQMKYPFVVGTVGGVSTVGITGQLIVDGSVTADKLKVNSLSALTANMGEVNGGTFRTFRLDGNGNVIDPNEFRCEMTNNPGDAYPMWIGSGVKNWNNAVFAVDRGGNAKFSGTITAGNVVSQLQVTGQGSWSGDVTAAGSTVLCQATLNGPIRLGESHTPWLIVEVLTYSSSSDDTHGIVWLEKLVGTTWVTVRSNVYRLRNGVTFGFTMVVFDAATSSAAQYRVRVSDAGLRGNDFHVTNVNIAATGIR